MHARTSELENSKENYVYSIFISGLLNVAILLHAAITHVAFTLAYAVVVVVVVVLVVVVVVYLLQTSQAATKAERSIVYIPDITY